MMRHAAAALLTALTLCLPAYGGEAQEGKNERVAEKSQESMPPPREKSAAVVDDLGYCKQQAQGLEGPARARFMTECLKRK